MQARHKRLLFIGASFLGASIFLLSSYAIIRKTKKNELDNKKQNENESITIKITGAVYYPGQYTFNKGIKLYKVLKHVKLKQNANVKNLNFDQEITKNMTLNISYNETYKINIREIKKYQHIVNLGIRKNIAIKIFNFIIKNNYNITWEQIEKIDGVGLRTMQLLKQKLTL